MTKITQFKKQMNFVASWVEPMYHIQFADM